MYIPKRPTFLLILLILTGLLGSSVLSADCERATEAECAEAAPADASETISVEESVPPPVEKSETASADASETAPVALYCGVNGTLAVYDIGADGQGTLAFIIALDDLRAGHTGVGLGNRLIVLGDGDAELFALDLLSAYSFRFNPAECAA
jgi:hypothetical protein